MPEANSAPKPDTDAAPGSDADTRTGTGADTGEGVAPDATPDASSDTTPMSDEGAYDDEPGERERDGEPGNGSEGGPGSESGSEPEGGPGGERAGLTPRQARRIRIVLSAAVMIAVAVALVIRLNSAPSVLTVGFYGIALILSGTAIVLSRRGRTRVATGVLALGFGAVLLAEKLLSATE